MRRGRTCSCILSAIVYLCLANATVCVACEIVTSTANQRKSKVRRWIPSALGNGTCRLLWQEIKLTGRNVLVPQCAVPHSPAEQILLIRHVDDGTHVALCAFVVRFGQTIDLKPQGLAKVALHQQPKMTSTLDPRCECIWAPELFTKTDSHACIHFSKSFPLLLTVNVLHFVLPWPNCPNGRNC